MRLWPIRRVGPLARRDTRLEWLTTERGQAALSFPAAEPDPRSPITKGHLFMLSTKILTVETAGDRALLITRAADAPRALVDHVIGCAFP